MMFPLDEEPEQPSGDSSVGSIEGENAKAFTAAASFIRQGASPDADGLADDARQLAEQRQIIRWIEAGHGRLIPDEELADWCVISDKTSEHKVFIQIREREC